MLAAEAVNTAVEQAVNLASPQRRMREKEEAVMTSVGLPRGESYVMFGNR